MVYFWSNDGNGIGMELRDVMNWRIYLYYDLKGERLGRVECENVMRMEFGRI